MANTDEKRPSGIGGGVAATVLGAALTIGAIVLSNKEVRNKLLKMVSQGIDTITENGAGVKDSLSQTADKVGKSTRKTIETVKETVDNLVEDEAKGVRRAATK